MFGWETALEGADGNVFKITIHHIVHLPISVRVCLQGLSLSLILKDSRKNRGQGTLLQVMKREPNAWVSSLKEFMESGFKLSNHLIATDPKLDGKTLHIRALSLEWTAIL